MKFSITVIIWIALIIGAGILFNNYKSNQCENDGGNFHYWTQQCTPGR